LTTKQGKEESTVQGRAAYDVGGSLLATFGNRTENY